MLPDQLHLGPVRISVSDVERSLDWYERSIGLTRVTATSSLPDGVDAGLASEDGPTVIELVAEPTSRPARGAHAGLYHVALLYASREELSWELRRLVAAGTQIQGASDHVTHEAIYLPDPDGNGLELAADLPRERWPSYEEQYGHGPQALDAEALLAVTDGAGDIPAHARGVQTGHLHLHVGDLPRAIAFYRDAVGFDLIADLGSAAFVSAGGYHHHLGMNVWKGEGVPPSPSDAFGLRRWNVDVPSSADLDAIAERLTAAEAPAERVDDTTLVTRDPWGHELHVHALA